MEGNAFMLEMYSNFGDTMYQATNDKNCCGLGIMPLHDFSSLTWKMESFGTFAPKGLTFPKQHIHHCKAMYLRYNAM